MEYFPPTSNKKIFNPLSHGLLNTWKSNGAEEREWIMMGTVNIASIMEYRRPGDVLRKEYPTRRHVFERFWKSRPGEEK
jgi:hypothetical protein